MDLVFDQYGQYFHVLPIKGAPFSSKRVLLRYDGIDCNFLLPSIDSDIVYLVELAVYDDEEFSGMMVYYAAGLTKDEVPALLNNSTALYDVYKNAAKGELYKITVLPDDNVMVEEVVFTSIPANHLPLPGATSRGLK